MNENELNPINSILNIYDWRKAVLMQYMQKLIKNGLLGTFKIVIRLSILPVID